MEHKKSIFQFEDSKGTEWIVEYYYTPSIYGGNSLCAAVYEGEELYHDFGGRLPNTRTDNPTKTQAKEIISAAKKINKERDKRDSKINKILDGAKQTD